MLTLESFEQASEIVKEVTQETKLVKSNYFTELTGNRVYLKPENMQFTGAYKVRGAYYKISTLTKEERKQLIKENPAYGNIICRCETISEGEILDACRRGMKPVSLDGIKRRTGAGMGRCQGGFCGAGIVAILAEETGIDPLRICQDKAGSRLFAGRTKSAGGTDD